jgi:hypothetical protein
LLDLVASGFFVRFTRDRFVDVGGHV